MKKIYLIRHAKSSWKNSGLKDIDRPLNKRGKRDAPFMGKRLYKYKVHPDLIISSPAKRAFKTAKAIAEQTDYPVHKIIRSDILYLASIKEFMKTITNIKDNISSVFIISHNPGITDLAEYLSGKFIDNIPTCGVYCIEFESESWTNIKENSGKKVFFDYPKKHV